MNYYLTCFYQGNERLSLWFGNPNYTGAWLAILAVAAGAIFWCFRRRVWIGVAITAVVAFPCYVAVGMTYSRAAYLGVATALGILAVLRSFSSWKKHRAPHAYSLAVRIGAAWIPLAFFLVVLCCLPAGGRRLASMGDVSSGENQDLSIIHRFYLWQGGTMLIAQYPRHGVGDCPGKLYAHFYQPLGKEENYKTLLNDFLTLAAAKGLPMAGLILTMALLPIALALALWKWYDDELALQLAAALGAYLFAGMFNTCFQSTTTQCTFVLLGGIIVFRGGWHIWKQRKDGIQLRWLWVLLLAPAVATAICGGVYGLGRHFSAQWYYTIAPDILNCQEADCLQLYPRIPNGTRMEYFCEEPLKSLRSELLPLVSNGYEVHAWRNLGGLDGIQTIATILQENAATAKTGQRWLVAATDNAANATMGAIKGLPPEQQPDGVILCRMLLHHPFSELSLENWSWERPVILIPLDVPEKRELEKLRISFPQLQSQPMDTTVLNALTMPEAE